MSASTAVAAYRRELANFRANPDALSGLPTGIPTIDWKTGGLGAGEVIVIGGRTSMGKTAVLLHVIANVCEHLLREGDARIVALVSAELSETKIIERFVSSRTRLPVKAVRWPRNDVQQKQVENALAVISMWPLSISDQRGPELNAVKEEVNRMAGGWRKGRGESPLALLVVDHLGKLWVKDSRGNRMDSEYATISTVADSLFEMAAYYHCPVIEAAQVNRNVESKVARDRDGDLDFSLTRPQPSDIQGSGKIEQNADQIWLLWREERYRAMYESREEHTSSLEINIAKSRSGETGAAYVQFVPECTALDVPAAFSLETDSIFESKEERRERAKAALVTHMGGL